MYDEPAGLAWSKHAWVKTLQPQLSSTDSFSAGRWHPVPLLLCCSRPGWELLRNGAP